MQSNEAFKEKWEGPFRGLRSTPAAIKGDGISALIHLSRGKPALTHKERKGKRKSAENLKFKLVKAWKYDHFYAV